MPVYALLGRQLGHSFSKSWFNAKFEREGLQDHSYINIETEELKDIRILLDSNRISGLNVTIPFKSAIIPFLDGLDEIAGTIGAVNTVTCSKDGKLFGYNTDWIGFYETLKPLLRPYHTQALVLGSGGASVAVRYVLDLLGIDYILVSRNTGPGIVNYDSLTQKDVRNAPLIINTSPVGTYPDTESAPDIPYSGIEKFHLLYDLVYNPAETLFIRRGKAAGAATINGYPMLIRQAEESWKIWNSFRSE